MCPSFREKTHWKQRAKRDPHMLVWQTTGERSTYTGVTEKGDRSTHAGVTEKVDRPTHAGVTEKGDRSTHAWVTETGDRSTHAGVTDNRRQLPTCWCDRKGRQTHTCWGDRHKQRDVNYVIQSTKPVPDTKRYFNESLQWKIETPQLVTTPNTTNKPQCILRNTNVPLTLEEYTGLTKW